MSQALWEGVRDIISTFSLEFDNDTLQDLSCAICKGIIIDASQLICGCKFCRRCIQKYLENGGKHCPGNDNDFCCTDFKSMNDVHCESECNNVILALKVKCPTNDCFIEAPLEDMVIHWRQCRQSNGYSIQESAVSSTVSHDIVTVTNLVDANISTGGGVDFKIETSKSDDDTMEELQIQIKALKKKKKKLEKKIDETNKRVNCLEIDQAKRVQAFDVLFEEERFEEEKHDIFLCTIDNFSQWRNGKNCLFSEPFFVFKNGYKMRLIMYPHGAYDDRYVSLYFVTFTVIAQNGGPDHSLTVVYLHHKGRQYVYERPLSSHNVPLGASEFVEYSSLVGSLVIDDVMFLSCSVTKSPWGINCAL